MSTRRWRADVAERRLDELIPAAPTCGGYRLDRVARRLASSAPCVCCGFVGAIWGVNVRSRRDGRLTTITLCERCAHRDGGAWTLRWVPVPFDR